MENHLIIGIGGTGGRVLAAYRKLIFEKYNGNLKPDNLWINYLYVDSSVSDLKMEGNQWNVMGKSVKLEDRQVLAIPAADLSSYVNNRNRYSYLSPWIGNTEDWKYIINDPKITNGAAGQKRRLGRLLFANKADQFNAKVNTAIENLRLNPDGSSITFHVVAGLAGGTGSGSIIDVIAQLRHKYSDHTIYTIILYLLLPEEIPDNSWATTENYKPNGYAALSELNALDLKLFKPWNVGERKNKVKQLDLESPYYSAYLVTDQNINGICFDIGKVVPASMAEFLFQKTVGIENSQTKTNSEGTNLTPKEFLHSAERGENPDYSEYGSPHSFKFMTYGIKRLAIPEQEITEYFGYSFSLQALNAMLYNHYSSEMGYITEPITDDDYSTVIAKENKKRWCITRDHLCLSEAILDVHKKENWEKINDEFKVVNDYQVMVTNDHSIKRKDQLVAVENKTKQFYERKFRPIGEDGLNGVKNFYSNKKKNGKEAISSHILALIENDLFRQWNNGEKSLWQIKGMIEALIKHLGDEKDNMDTMEASATSSINSLSTDIDSLKKEWESLDCWSKIGKATGFGSKIDTIMAKHTAAVKQKYILMTWKYGYDFAKELIDDISKGLAVVKDHVDTLIMQFQEVSKQVKDEIATRCKPETEENQSIKSMLIKYYDPTKVKKICRQASLLKDLNKTRTDSLRNMLINTLNKDKHCLSLKNVDCF